MAGADLAGRRIGRYQLTRHLASGGMAEIFLARQEGVGGFQKDLCLKTIAGRYADNQKVVGMFLEEARLAATLNHPNIVHVYDVGEEGGLHFIAMEYIHGETVSDIVRRGIEVGSYLPREHAVHIVSQAAEGLGYAHERRDAAGRTQRIVHRDISPSNLIVTYQGVTKIVDFGIARAEDQIREEAGMRPGKVSYMAPEQVKGEPVDHRSDIFSLGIVLYEVTLGRRLWKGPPEVVMRRIVEEKVPPPTFVRRDYPPMLELVVMKALEKDPRARHQSAHDLHRELDDFLAEAGLRTGNRRIADYLKALFAPGAKVSAEGARQAREFAGEDTPRPSGGGIEAAEDVSEELNFDRRPSRTLNIPGPSIFESVSGARRVAPDEAPPRKPDEDGPPTVRSLPPIDSGPASGAPLAPAAGGSRRPSDGPPPVPPAPAFGAGVIDRAAGRSGRLVTILVVLAAIGAGLFLALR